MTGASADLVRQYGDPQRTTTAGSHVEVWALSERGDGVVVTRQSGQETKQGQTMAGQAREVLETVRQLGLSPRYLISTNNNSGARRYEERPDFALIEQAIWSGKVSWVAFRGVDRIARKHLPAELFYDLLQRTSTGLVLAQLGREVDWRTDASVLRMFGIVSDEERSVIEQRTQGALMNQFVNQGRGWPGCQPFGFRRHPLTKNIEVDPEQWPFVIYVANRYSELSGSADGLRRIERELAEQGCPLSVSRIRRILVDPMYVTGEWWINKDGRRVAGRRVRLRDPILPEVYERNQQLLALRQGKMTRTPLGFFLLNGISVIHTSCEHERNGRGLQPRLKGRLQAGRKQRSYRHAPFVPSGCRGFSVDQDVLERLVVEQLHRLALAEPLIRAWRERTSLSEVAANGSDRELDCRNRIHGLERSLAQLRRDYLDRLANGDETDELAYADLTSAVRTEIAGLKRRISAISSGQTPSRPAASESLSRQLARVVPLQRPQDRNLLAQRAAVVHAALQRVVVREEDGGLYVELESPLIPPAVAESEASS